MMSASMKNIKSVAAHNINLFTTAVDRWSPLAYSLADWIQTDVSIHSCHESTFRKSLNFCFILQGLSLFEEIRSSCVFCTKLRAKFIQATMGPKDPSAYALAPPLWVTQADLYGPIVTYVPGRERNTRAHRDLTSKCWTMVSVCNLSKDVNIQVVKGHDAHHLADGLTRLCCEVGAPARLLIDRDSAFMKVLQEGHINILDVENHMRKKTTMAFQLAKNTDLPAYAQPDGSPALFTFQPDEILSLLLHITPQVLPRGSGTENSSPRLLVPGSTWTPRSYNLDPGGLWTAASYR